MSEKPNSFLLKQLNDLILEFEQELPKADRLLKKLFREKRIGSRDRPLIRDRFYFYIRQRGVIQALCDHKIQSYAEATNALYDSASDDHSYLSQKRDELEKELAKEQTEVLYNSASDNHSYWIQKLDELEKELAQGQKDLLYLNYPDWLWKEAQAVYGNSAPQVLQWLDGRAPTTLRINPLKMDHSTVIKKLARDGIDTRSTQLSPWGLVVSDGERKLSATNLYKYGCFELQDESSQLVCSLVNPHTSSLLDACAGGGGKTLNIGALYPDIALTATDIREYKLKDLAKRAKIAGVEVETCTIPELAGRNFDTVLIDAPCTGSGVLRRNPEDRWRIKASDLNQTINLQRQCLEQYSAHLKSGGELIYITCSFIRKENEDNIEWFLSEHTEYELQYPGQHLKTVLGDVDFENILQDDYIRMFPGGERDVFFAAVLRKKD